jgi:cytoskeletal protein CcmA (bactofilin family)
MFEIGKKRMSEEGQEKSATDAKRADSSAAAARSTGRAPRAGSREAAIIGPSIQIDGDVRGDEDLIVQGEVSGTIQLAHNSLTIGAEGKINANVHAHSIYVDGIVEGDLYGSDRVCIRKTAQVNGNITSPRVSLDEGARFKGSIEMDPEAVEAVLGSPRGAASSGASQASHPAAGAAPKSNGEGKYAAAKPPAGNTAAKGNAPT